MSADLSCPVCGSEMDMSVAFAHESDQRALARLATVSIPMGARVLQYLTLFTPPKTRLTAAKKIKLILQLLPDLERRAVTFKGRDWAAPLDVWAQAIDQMLAARDLGRLELPMRGHGYLYAVLSGMADKCEASAEAQREQQRRTGPVGTMGPATQAMPAHNGQSQDQDPALAKMDAATRNAAPMPAAVRARIAELKKAKT